MKKTLISIGLIMIVTAFSNVYANTHKQQLLDRSCNRGHIDDCGRLGYAYAYGVEGQVRQDHSKAIGVLNKACNGRDMESCTILGYVYGLSKGKEENYTKAIEALTKACDAEEMHGCGKLGFMYAVGRGVEVDRLRAERLLNKACNGGDEATCRLIEEEEWGK
jgi:hypothetical protein